MRSLYKYLLQMHPPSFRRQFGAELLWIFDEAAESEGALWLCFDCLVSLIRQQVRSGYWKLVAAVVGAGLQISAGGLIWVALGQHGLHGNASVPDGFALDRLMRLILGSGCAIVLMVTAASLWMRSFVRRRNRGLRVHR